MQLHIVGIFYRISAVCIGYRTVICGGRDHSAYQQQKRVEVSCTGYKI
jgi:hypothetical protein